jgi:hypothetical protein
MHNQNQRTPLLYRSRVESGGPLGERKLYYFYPEGEWDGWRRREETCEAAYPQTEYEWIDMNADFDPTIEGSIDFRYLTVDPAFESEAA